MWPGGGGGGCEFWQSDADSLENAGKVPEGTVVVTNVPYGMRIQGVERAVGSLNNMLTSRPDLHAYALAKTGTLQGVSLSEMDGWMNEWIEYRCSQYFNLFIHAFVTDHIP